MLLVYFVLTGLLGASCNFNLVVGRGLASEDNFYEDEVVSCVTGILSRHYNTQGQLTFVEMGYGDDRLLRAIHSLTMLSVIYRKSIIDYVLYNQAYLVTVDNASDFVDNFQHLTREPTWNPHTKFIIVVKRVKECELREIFDVLLRSHVINVLVVNGRDLSLYTYNPFENYGCGKYYNRTIHFGSCPSVTVDLYPYKLVTRLQRCTISVVVAHVPPYTVDPSKISRGMLAKGIEQYALEMAAEKEQFNINYVYEDFGEEYSTFSDNFTFNGPLSMLQNGKTDMMVGAGVLSPTRAAALDYTSAHLNLEEEVKCIVKKASVTPAWKYFYLEFEPTVWLLLLFIFVVIAVFIIMLLKTRDWIYVFLALLDTLVLHGLHSCNPQSCRAVKCIGICWLWFAYLVNCFYLSNLSSITIKPGNEPQISNMYDLQNHRMKPCVSIMVSKLLRTERNVIVNSTGAECKLFFDSIRTVSHSEDMFTIVLNTLYKYHQYDFYDEHGNDLVYVFDYIIFKISYAIFMYKGFPLKQSLFETMIKLRENGLIQRHSNLMNYVMKYYKLNRFRHKKFEVRFIFPWYLISFGIVMSGIAFLAEVFSRFKMFQV